MDISGLLLIPSNKNGNAIKNILSIVFNKCSIEYNNLPFIDKITFLETDDLKEIQLDGETYSAHIFYEKVLTALNLNEIELRRKKIHNYATDIPNTIVSAIHEVGKNNIVLDLTNGKRDITGSIYTVASICEIENMIYIEVYRQNNGKDFYELSTNDITINNKYHLTKFKPLDEMENLASLNFMEFIAYKKNIANIKYENNCQKLELYCEHLNNAIEFYFQSKTDQCIRNIGIVNEELVGLISKILAEKYNSITKIIEKHGNSTKRSSNIFYYIDICNDAYINLCGRKSLTKEEMEARIQLSEVFSYIPTLSHLLTSIKNYRNQVSHGLNNHLHKEDAKIVIDFILKILNGLKQSGLLLEILNNE